MKCSNRIYHRPFIPANRLHEPARPFVCRVMPGDGCFSGEWIDNGCAGHHTLVWQVRGQDETHMLPLTSDTFTVTGLENGIDYAFFIEAENGEVSRTRFVRPGPLPEGASVINYLHPEDEQYAFSGRYLASPSLVRLHTGTIIAGMDVHAANCSENLVILFKSMDGGKTFRYLTDLYPFFWSTLFEHRNILYIIGASTAYGNLQISASYDEGETWTVPVTLIYGGTLPCTNGGVHRAPMAVVPYRGRLYTTCEYGTWRGDGFTPSVISIDENADLLVPENWQSTGFLPYEGAWKAASDVRGDSIEGNVVPAPDDTLYLYLRWKLGEVLRMTVSTADPEMPLTFDRILPMPVTDSMFKIVMHHGHYYLVTTRKTEVSARISTGAFRNVLSIFRSDDLEDWSFLCDIINCETQNAEEIGFQYPQVIDDGEGGFLVSVRSGFNGAHNFHDSNHILLWHIPAERL